MGALAAPLGGQKCSRQDRSTRNRATGASANPFFRERFPILTAGRAARTIRALNRLQGRPHEGAPVSTARPYQPGGLVHV